MSKITTETGSGPEEQNQNTPTRDLAELESIIAKGLPTYQEVGSALDEIHSRKLYKPHYKNFRTYLLERWGISRAHGYRLIAAARLAVMSPAGDKTPANEHQARKRLTSAKGRTKPEKPSKVIFDLEAEFEMFTTLVTRWEKGLSNPDYRGLLERVDLYLDNILCDGPAKGMEAAA
jgi:hypothetical protein